MWRNEEKNLSCGGIYPHEKCGHKFVLQQYTLFGRKICFVAIYAVLLLNLSCRDLRAFAWRKNKTKNCVCGEKGQISGMAKTHDVCIYHTFTKIWIGVAKKDMMEYEMTRIDVN